MRGHVKAFWKMVDHEFEPVQYTETGDYDSARRWVEDRLAEQHWDGAPRWDADGLGVDAEYVLYEPDGEQFEITGDIYADEDFRVPFVNDGNVTPVLIRWRGEIQVIKGD